MEPKTAGQMLNLLREKYGKLELSEMSKESGIPVSTLDWWQKLPETRFTAKGRAHYRRIFEGAAPVIRVKDDSPDLTQLLTEVRDLLRGLLALDKQGRAHEVIKAKAKRQGGAA